MAKLLGDDAAVVQQLERQLAEIQRSAQTAKRPEEIRAQTAQVKLLLQKLVAVVESEQEAS